MKLVSWNVNGIRACLKKGFLDFVAAEDADIICLQETRGQPDELDSFLPQYHQFWNHAQKKGYSGTAIFVKKSRKKDLQIVNHGFGMDQAQHDQEGRITLVELPRFSLLSTYTPNSGNELKRLDYRQDWDQAYRAYCQQLNQKKPLIFCGDLNVAHTEIDLTNPKTNRRNAGFTDEERDGFSRLLDAGFVDSFRLFEKEGGHYTWWSYRANARARNIGWRIDYFCVSRQFTDQIKAAGILPAVMGSDHCPVSLTIK
ncbi:MAG: exodeoxyribonuclease III [Leptospiraceae bacterium]|nr:exodeoxyribonuclease III [Leptospiraceae bacterium]